MTAVAVTVPKKSVVIDMATRFGMEPQPFEKTLRATVVPHDCSAEQFAAFLLVAKEYDLNPILKEIYAFPSRGGGIQPIVSVDGWSKLVNRQPSMDGIEFDDNLVDGNLISITAKIWRKDRSKPITVTEYMEECVRSTDTWKKWPRRMLRHKALIQAARYAFGFSGIVDPDEAERINEVRDVTPLRAPPPEPEEPELKGPPPQTNAEIIAEAKPLSPATLTPPPPDDDIEDPEVTLKRIDELLAGCVEGSEIEKLWNEVVDPMVTKLLPPDQSEAQALLRKHMRRVEP